MLEGVLDVRLLPRWSPSSVRSDLMAALSRAQHLQAGIGYWTIDEGLLGPHLARTLGEPRGFVCVDLHAPTDVDALASLARQGAHVRIYYEDIPTFTAAGRKEPPYLLHAKLLLFWLTDGTAELWVGSHNWTNRALLGLNVEASLVMRLCDTAPLVSEVAAYLAKMREISEPFDPTRVDLYKAIQRRVSDGLVPVIELTAGDGLPKDDETIAIFGTDADDLNRLDRVRREVHVALLAPESGEEHMYPASVVHSGLLAAADEAAGGLSFSPRPHAFRQGRERPLLRTAGPVDPRILDTARYFVTLHLGARQAEPVASEAAPRRVAMREVAEDLSPLVGRLDPVARAWLFQGRAPRVKQPVVVGVTPPRFGRRRRT